MGDMSATIENVLIQNVLAASKLLPQASRASHNLLMFAGGCFLAGTLLLVYALYLWLLITVGQLMAVVCTGVIFLMLAGLSAGGLVSYRDKKIAQVRSEITETLLLALQLVKSDVGEAVQGNPKMTIAAASLVGFVVGRKFL
jgi:hypothetical protein